MMYLVWLPRLILTLLVGLLAFPAAGSTTPAHLGTTLSICVRRDTGAVDPAALIRAPRGFDCASDQHRLGPGDYWAVSERLERLSSAEAPLHVHFASLWQDGITLYVLYADGAVRSMTTDHRGIAPLIQLGAVADMTLPRRDVPIVRLMWHVRGAANMRGILLGAQLITEPEANSANIQMGALYAGFAGVCIALIIYNLALWGALRHRFQLYYCLMVGLLLAYTYSSSGALAWTFPDLPNNWRLRTNYLLLGWTGAAAVVFARGFFEERVFSGWVGRFAITVALLMGVSGTLFFLTAPWALQQLDGLFTCSFLGLVAFVGITLSRAWTLKSRYRWLFALGWGAPILASALRTLTNLHLLPWSFWIDNSTLIAMMLEALTSGIVVAYRIKLLREERDEAIERAVLARRLADTDPLTGLLNRRAFLRQAIGRPGEQILMLADLDHFKSVNETLGHDGGDEVLRVFARTLRAVVPPDALIARMGGEEFALLASAAEAPEADALLAKLRITRMPFDLHVTASIGTCRGSMTSETDWKALYRGADAALFEAKSAGRDRVRQALRQAA